MQLSLFTLTTLVAPYIAMTVSNVGVGAAPATTPNKLPECAVACVTTPMNPCPDFDDYTSAIEHSIPFKTQKMTDVNRGGAYEKKEWYIEQKTNDPKNSNWFGGHVLSDGSMRSWARGTTDAGKLHAVRYTTTDPKTKVNELVYYWLAAGDTCTGAPKNFQFYNTVTAVTVLTAPAPAP